MPLLMDPETNEVSIEIVPVCIGPTWRRHPEWTPEDPIYVLPGHVGIATLAWEIIDWVGEWIIDPDESDVEHGILVPFQLTDEQIRFLLWWYAVDERGRFMYRRGILQRLKGWGKDPLAAIMALVELVGPCRFSYWVDGETGEILDEYQPGAQPVAKRQPNAYVQVAAVSQEQTDNTMSMIDVLMSPDFRKKFGIEALKLTVYSRMPGFRGRIRAVTSNPRTLEGNRPTFVILNETHHWIESNNGHAMAKVLDGNITKAKGGNARQLAITNAYEPGEGSVAQRHREAWQAEQDGLAPKTRVLYDSLEAPDDARVIPEVLDARTREVIRDRFGDPIRPDDELIKRYLSEVVEVVKGDSWWLDTESIVDAIMDSSNPASDSRRKYFNQIVGAEDRWLDKAHITAAIEPSMVAAREITTDPLRVSWKKVAPEEPIVMFGDGSLADDSTGIVGMVISTGYFFTIGVWQKPKGAGRTRRWRAPRGEVDARVDEAMERFNVVAFLFDPSHAKDYEDSTPYWDSMVDGWHQKYGDKLAYWAVQGGDRRHSVMWDMTSPTRQQEFVRATERFREEMRQGGTYTHDGHPALIEHLLNARVNIANKWGDAIMKEHRESARKIDLAVCAVGASMLRRFVKNQGLDQKPSGGVFYAPVPGYDSL